MKTAMYLRKGKTIQNIEAKKNQTYASINAAKRESAKLQKETGSLGNGILRIVNKLPKIEEENE